MIMSRKQNKKSGLGQKSNKQSLQLNQNNGEKVSMSKFKSSINNIFTKNNFLFLFAFIGFIASFLTILEKCYNNNDNYINNFSSTQLKDSIRNELTEIKTEYNLGNLGLDSNIHPDVDLIKKFQKSVLELIVYWEEIESTPNHSTLIKNDIRPLSQAIKSWYSNLHTRDSITTAIFLQIAEIKKYGENNNIKQFIPNPSKTEKLHSLLNLKQQTVSDAYTNCKSTLKNMDGIIDQIYFDIAYDIPDAAMITDSDYIELSDNIYSSNEINIEEMENNKQAIMNLVSDNKDKEPKGNYIITDEIFSQIKPHLLEAIDFLDALKINSDYYQFDYYLFQYLIELNKMYNLQISNY